MRLGLFPPDKIEAHDYLIEVLHDEARWLPFLKLWLRWRPVN